MAFTTDILFYTLAAGGIGYALYASYRMFSAPSGYAEPTESTEPPSLGGRRTHKRKHHGKKTKKHYLKK